MIRLYSKVTAFEYFEPQRVRVSGFKLALGGLFADGVTTRDHKGKVKTTSFGSIGRYLEKYDLSTEFKIYKG
ncbi:DUF2145 domain-containing protein [Thalassotalea euphylliae]|uniref:DUF2145 domain-containing protein n=1 Tax=Thalassotalea euphylliae TaxID=1655234 RepID=A0A3E0TLT8_9GAMM|nr:DUF2145 domain-containing protein [Thalassotalea euphylliae]